MLGHLFVDKIGEQDKKNKKKNKRKKQQQTS